MATKKRAQSTKSAKKEVNKSKAIRDLLEKDPDARPQAVAQSLAAKGVDVSAAFVSQVKLKMKQRGAAGSTPSSAAGAGQFAGTELMEAKRLIDKIGVDKARAAVELLAKLS